MPRTPFQPETHWTSATSGFFQSAFRNRWPFPFSCQDLYFYFWLLKAGGEEGRSTRQLMIDCLAQPPGGLRACRGHFPRCGDRVALLCGRGTPWASLRGEGTLSTAALCKRGVIQAGGSAHLGPPLPLAVLPPSGSPQGHPSPHAAHSHLHPQRTPWPFPANRKSPVHHLRAQVAV